MGKRIVIIAVLLLCAAGTLSASAITYVITVDTSSVSGTAGSLDFQFNPGPLVTQDANLQLLNFTSDGTLAGNCPCGIGDVSGQLPGTVTFDNGSGLNDYFDGFTYGNSLSFDVSLYGPALTLPDGVSTSGSEFVFSMFSDAGGTVPTLTSDTADGFAVLLDVNLDGSTTPTNLSAGATVVPQAPVSTPEPSSLLLLGSGLVGLIGIASCNRRTSSKNA